MHENNDLFDFEQFMDSCIDPENDFLMDSTVSPRMESPLSNERHAPVQLDLTHIGLQNTEAARGADDELSANSLTGSGLAQVKAVPATIEENPPTGAPRESMLKDDEIEPLASPELFDTETDTFLGLLSQMLQHQVFRQDIRFGGLPEHSEIKEETAHDCTMIKRIVSLAGKAFAVYGALNGCSVTYRAERKSSRSSVRSKGSNKSQGRVENDRQSSGGQSTTGSGYEEIVFDSKSAHSDRSLGSGCSRRRGPLSKAAKAGMKALKEVGNACWRCKYLRKPVSLGSKSPHPLIIGSARLITPVAYVRKEVRLNGEFLGVDEANFSVELFWADSNNRPRFLGERLGVPPALRSAPRKLRLDVMRGSMKTIR
jgi:hypothetical protein